MSQSKSELEQDNAALREENRGLVNQVATLQQEAQQTRQELIQSNLLELQVRRELEQAQKMLAGYMREEGALSKSQLLPNSSESSLPSPE